MSHSTTMGAGRGIRRRRASLAASTARSASRTAPRTARPRGPPQPVASTMYGRFAASQVRMAVHNFVACRSSGVIAARSIPPISLTPTLAGISPRVWRSPIRKIVIMSGPRTTYQGSAAGSSSMRRFNSRASSGESGNVAHSNSSLVTVHVFSSTNRGTLNPPRSITGWERTAAHLRRPKTSARSRRPVRTSSPVSFSNRSIFGRFPYSARTLSSADERQRRHSRSWASVSNRFSDSMLMPINGS